MKKLKMINPQEYTVDLRHPNGDWLRIVGGVLFVDGYANTEDVLKENDVFFIKIIKRNR